MIKRNDYVRVGGKVLRVKDGLLDTEYGVIDSNDIIGKTFGEIEASGKKIVVSRPSFPELAPFFRGGPQLILPKDLGAVISFSGIGEDDILVEGGSGSGFTASFFSTICKKVYSYEIRDDYHKQARENAGNFDIDFKIGDLYSGFPEKATAVFFDLPEPWKVPLDTLRAGGKIVYYVPTTDQIREIKKNSPYKFRFLEIIARDWKAGPTRPENTGLLHTAFLCFARKLNT